MEIPFTTFSKLSDQISSFDGNIKDPEDVKKLIQFYQYWSNYLNTVPAFLSFLASPLGGLAKGLYYFTASLEHVFNNLFKLFGLFGYLSNQETLIGQIYHWLQLLGVLLFIFLMVTKAIFGLIGKPIKYKNILTHFTLVTVVVAVLPWGVTQLSTALANDAQNIQNVSVNNGESDSYDTLAIQPLRNNVVDLKQLIDEDFDTSKFPMDEAGFIKPVQSGNEPVNKITDREQDRLTSEHISNVNFAATFGVTDTDLLEKFEEKNKGMKGLLLHKISATGDDIDTIKEHRMVGAFNAFGSVYFRYKVNWLGMFAQFIVLIVLLIMMSVKMVKSIFEVVLTAIIAPIQGYSSVDSSKKFKELLLTLVGALAGIFFEIIIMRVTLEIMRDLPSVSLNGVQSLTGNFFDGLNMWEQCISSIIVYLGLFFAAMGGVGIIERWLGVSTNHSDTMQQMIGGMMMANAAMDAGKMVAHVGAGVVGGSVKGGKTLAGKLSDNPAPNGPESSPGMNSNGISGSDNKDSSNYSEKSTSSSYENGGISENQHRSESNDQKHTNQSTTDQQSNAQQEIQQGHAEENTKDATYTETHQEHKNEHDPNENNYSPETPKGNEPNLESNHLEPTTPTESNPGLSDHPRDMDNSHDSKREATPPSMDSSEAPSSSDNPYLNQQDNNSNNPFLNENQNQQNTGGIEDQTSRSQNPQSGGINQENEFLSEQQSNYQEGESGLSNETPKQSHPQGHHFQKAEQHRHGMNQKMRMGSQQMGSARNHIKGKEIEEDDD